MKKIGKNMGENNHIITNLMILKFDKYGLILMLSALTDPFGSLTSQGLQKSF